MSTYGQMIQDLNRDIAKINKSVEWLRDAASPEEKKYFNATRQALFNAEGYMRELDEKIEPGRRNMELD